MTTQDFDPRAFLADLLRERLDPAGLDWLEGACEEVAGGIASTRFGALLSLASRHVPARPLEPGAAALARAEAGLRGWNPERWDLRETARVRLLLSRRDLAEETFAADLEQAFRFADEGELRALYKALALLPGGERFVWRAAEGCRTNIVPVFESVACDSPYPARHFDDIAWNQLVIKALFIGAPLWRVHGLDGRLSEDLARMALDLADERRSAGRAVPPELWLALGTHAGERGRRSLEAEVATGDTLGARAAALALRRLDGGDWSRDGCDQAAFRAFDPRETR